MQAQLFMKLICILFFLVNSVISIAQTSVITGRLFADNVNYAIFGANVGISGKSFVVSDTNGHFLITTTINTKDSIVISMVGYRTTYIFHIPVGKDTIEFGNIRLFDGYKGSSMIDFFCRWYQIRCKRNAKQYWQKEYRKYDDYVKLINAQVDQYLYSFENKNYKLSYNNDYVNLRTEIDLTNPCRP